MRYLILSEILEIYSQVMQQSGGAIGIRDLGALESAIAQPQMTFGGKELYPAIEKKAAALCYSLVQNHPFVDGNKRTAHAAMEIFLLLNGHEIDATVDEQEKVILQIAGGEMARDEFTEWLLTHVMRRKS